MISGQEDGGTIADMNDLVIALMAPCLVSTIQNHS
jgi:hypothetical protein